MASGTTNVSAHFLILHQKNNDVHYELVTHDFVSPKQSPIRSKKLHHNTFRAARLRVIKFTFASNENHRKRKLEQFAN